MSESEREGGGFDARGVLDALWARTLEAWDDDKPHNAALEFALKNEKLPDLAGRYRALLDDPEKGPRAKKRIDAIVIAATQMLMAMKSTPAPKSPPWLTVVAGLAMIVLFAFLAYAMMGGARLKP